MLIELLTPEKVRPHFNNTYYHRGVGYYQEDRVHDLNIEVEKNSEIITACVEGEGGNHYQVIIELSGEPDKIYFQSKCTCPIGNKCKHTVATLLTAIEEHEFMPDEADDDNIFERSKALPQNSQIDSWLNNLKSIIKEEKQPIKPVIDETYSLRYIFYNSNYSYNNSELNLKLQLVRQLKSGGLGAPKDFSSTADSHQRHLYPIDKDLIIKIQIAKAHLNGYYSYNDSFKGPLLEKYLPEILSTQRCHWAAPNPIILNLAESKTAEVSWQTDDKGTQELVFQFSEGTPSDYQIVIIDKPWYINKKTGQMGLFNTHLDLRLLKMLLSAPKLPPNAAEKLVNVLDESYKFDLVTRPKLLTTNSLETVTPRVRLKLYQAPLFKNGFDKSTWKTMQINKPLAALTFDYNNGNEIQWHDSRETLNLVNDKVVNIIKRNKKIENRAYETLINHGTVPLEKLSEYTQFKQNKEWLKEFILETLYCDPLNFSYRVLPELQRQGWEIEISPDYPYQIIKEEIDEWYSTIEEEKGTYNWFNLELGIILGEEKINLLPVLQQLLKKLQNTKNNLELSSEPILAELPNGRFIPLPAERIQRILNVLIELYDGNSLTEDDLLRLSKLHAARLLELEAATGAAKLRWYGGEKLKTLAEKLTQFKKIEEVAIPKEFKGELRPYQAEGLNWLQFLREYEFGGILADDMGLGKTIQTLCHLAIEKSSGRCQKPSLIIAPTSLMFNWYSEAQRFVPHLKVLILHGTQRKSFFEKISDYDLIFTTYPLLKQDKEILLKQEFYFLILDEAQSIKNAKSLATQIVQQIKAQHRLCLTGTPLENHLGELWSLFHFMMPGLLGDEKKFNLLFRKPIEKDNNQERRLHLNRRIAPFLLRRTKSEVIKELPEKINILQQLEIEGEQRDLYEMIRVTLQKKIKDEIAKLGFARSQIVILDALLKLRQICCDPRLLKTESLKSSTIKSAKLELLMTLLPELIEEGRRILLFSQFTEMLKLIETELKSQKIPYVQLTGQTKDRATPVKQFQEGEVPLFLISLKAGGTGLNLTAADTVIHYDPWWNPAVEDQATDRAHRIGQNKVVFVYKLVTKGTVEEKILEMQQNKRALMEGLFSETENNVSHLTEKHLQELFEPLK